jgi:transcriptional regulator with XRE-family HTH domain
VSERAPRYRLTYRVNAFEVGARIRARRVELGLAQRELAFPGCSYAYISRFERGDRTPSIGVLIALAERLQTTALELITGEPRGPCPFCGRDGTMAHELAAARWQLDVDGSALELVLDGGGEAQAELVEQAAAAAGVPLRRLR